MAKTDQMAAKAKGLFELGRTAEAATVLRDMALLEPGVALWQVNLGVVLKSLGRLDEAMASFRRAIELEPRHVDAHDYLGNALREVGRLAEGIAEHRSALALDANRPSVLSNLAAGLFAQGDVREAVRHFRRALELKPDFVEAHSNLIFALDHDPDISVAEQQQERKRWWALHGRRLGARIAPHTNDRDAARPLRIGYVSADFLGHSATTLFGPIVMGHDPVGFEVVGYSNSPREDEFTGQFKAHAKLWRGIAGMPDEVVAAQIRADAIDILVDLSGHSAGNRLLVFAQKPAPIQVTAWGYPTGTGLSTIDVAFADRILLPPEARGHFTEKIIDLPAPIVYAPVRHAPPVVPPPALRRGAPTLGSLNRLSKTPDECLRLWSKIVAEIPGGRLLLKDRAFDDAAQRSRVGRLLGETGLSEASIVIMGGTSHAEHLAAYAEVDLCLDPFPFGGGVTTLEALWMGVPVVSLLGRSIPSRSAAALETPLGLGDFIAKDRDDYARLALSKAKDIAGLASLRTKLRAGLAKSPICDVKVYVKAVEAAYRDLWTRWCAGLA